uniref:Fucolectin tachylectin-4 pentraxin-1 domain-containing protein n=1 Tax=Biomphalaria glabrata TaxID=6526 RepID=A0A2C9KPZ1_BIOGL
MFLKYVLTIYLASLAQACNDTRMFGEECQYRCHCANGCDTSGDCVNGTCARGWFGFKCQYRNSVVDATVEPKRYTSWLTDGVTDTCNSDTTISSVTLLWDEEFLFTWMTIEVNNASKLTAFKIWFIATGETYKEIPCSGQRLALINENTLKIFCDLKVLIEQVILEGEAVYFLCSLHVSGGRNVALMQETNQTTTHISNIFYGPQLAVDGDLNTDALRMGCSHTAINDTEPCWTVTFDGPRDVNKFIIYNRRDDKPERLKHFQLEAENEHSQSVFSYRDSLDHFLYIYRVNILEHLSMKSVTICQNETEKPFVTLCEVEAYGECLPGSWGLNCSNKCPSSCTNSCDRGDGSCNVICVGFSDPPDCTRACAVTRYGINCSQSCSGSCLNHHCHPENGSCVNSPGSSLDDHSEGNSSADSLSTGIGIGIGASCCLFLVILFIIIVVFKKRKRVPPRPTITPPRGYDDVDLSTPEENKYETIHDADLKKTRSDNSTNTSQQTRNESNVYVNTNVTPED